MPPKTPKYQASFERLYDEVKPLDFTKPATKKQFMELIGTFLKDQPVEKKESAPVEPIPVDLPSIKKKRATARKPKKESENEEGEAVAKKKTVIAPAPVKKVKKSTSAKTAKSKAK